MTNLIDLKNSKMIVFSYTAIKYGKNIVSNILDLRGKNPIALSNVLLGMEINNSILFKMTLTIQFLYIWMKKLFNIQISIYFQFAY